MTKEAGAIDPFHFRLGQALDRPMQITSAGGSACAAEAFLRKRMNRPHLKLIFTFAIGIAIADLTGCATPSRHQFAQPANDWRTRSGQLLYRTAKTTLIGEVLVRFSKNGDFELTFSKGPGVTLLTIRQSEAFAEVKGALARMGWSGPVDRAPKQLHGWLELREKIIHAQDRPQLRHVAGGETFLFRF
ncbi:MAG: hypothetical protein QOI22_1085 [Verrucomicrobiota bacterium]